MALLVGSGCAHRIYLDSDPPGAAIIIDKKTVGVTPTEIKVTWAPFKYMPVSVRLPGRRMVTLNLQKDLGLIRLFGQVLTFRFGKLSGKVPRKYHRAQFVRHHGPTGTWLPEDAY